MRFLAASSRRLALALAPYAAAVALPWLVCVVEAQYDMQAPLFALFFFVVVVGRFGGRWAGLLCALASAVGGSYYFLSPAMTWGLDTASIHESLLFLIATGTVVLIQDALQRKSKALRSALEMRDEFLAVAGHELNNPLTALHLRVESELRKLERGVPIDRDASAHFLNSQLQTIERLRTLIDELLDMSRIRAGRLMLNPEPLDLVTLVRDVVSRFGETAKAAGCEVSVKAPTEPIHGLWDRTRIDQVVTNLLSNALKYGAGAPVTVVVWATPTDARVQIVDHGCGIAAADQGRIFTRFERCSPTDAIGGLGLGLWIVQQILEACGGNVAVRSETGEGSTFEVRLPLHTIGPGTHYAAGT